MQINECSKEIMNKTLGTLISERIRSLGITQKKMCEDLGISSANTCSFLKGRRGVKYNVLIGILDYVGLTFGKEGEEFSSVKTSEIPAFFKECVKETGKHICELDLPVHSCTFVSFTTGSRMVKSGIIEKIMPMFGVTLLPYKEKED